MHGSQVSKHFIYVFFLVIHIEVGHWILAWLVEVACELGWAALDESGPVVPLTDGKSKPPPGEHTLRYFCES